MALYLISYIISMTPMTLPVLEAPNIREMMESFPGREFLKSPDKLTSRYSGFPVEWG